MYFLGIDIGGTTIKAGLVDESGAPAEARRIPTIATDLPEFVSALAALIAEFQQTASISGIGIGIPGLLCTQTRTIETSPNISCLTNTNLEKVLSDRFHLPVTMVNDANAGAYAEVVCGAARGLQHAAYLTLGTGLGCGLVLHKKLFVGASGYAGEFGHTTVEPNGRLCACGNYGCLEVYVSGSGMTLTAQELMPAAEGPMSAEHIYAAAMLGDAQAREVFRVTGRYLGIACANLMNLLNPQMIVVGGGVMASGDLLLKPAIEEAGRRAFPASFRDGPIVQSQLWPDAGMIGAAMVARDR